LIFNLDSLEFRATEVERLLPLVARYLNRSTESDPFHELTLGQGRIVKLLFEGPKNATTIGHVLGLSVSAVMQTSQKLIDQAIIEKYHVEVDRRVKTLRLTEKGNQLVRHRIESRMRQAKHLLKEMTDEEQHHAVEALRRLVNLASQYNESESEFNFPEVELLDRA